MPTQPDPAAESATCFVVMGFGKKTDFETGRVLDLDKSYKYLIKPAVKAADLNCVRADEILHSGEIDKPMYRMLLEADVVVADLSTSNRNAIYELGVRHALKPYTTVIIAEDQMMGSKFFDLSHIVIRPYHHLGEDIGASEVERFTAELTAALKEITSKDPADQDSPVYGHLHGLKQPLLPTEGVQPEKTIAASATKDVPAHSELIARVDAAQSKGDWVKAKMLLEEIREARRGNEAVGSSAEDPYIIQRLALATYQRNYPSPEAAFKEARDLLSLLDPETSNDTETLGLWGSVHKRTWEATKDPSALNEAIRGYERGFYLRNDFYNGINYAFLLNGRAANTPNLGEAIADFVQARRIRQEVIRICEKWLTDEDVTDASPAQDHGLMGMAARAEGAVAKRYWVLATLAEAHVGLEDGLGDASLAKALAAAPEEWMKKSTQEQVNKLKALLAASPLKKLSIA
jgi:MAP3K TRAFs-binding domain